MFARINSVGLGGVDGYMVEVEADAHQGIPGFFITGALSTETREAQFRVWNAVKNSGIRIEPKKITVNLSPASVRKNGTAYDLAIAAALLVSCGILRQEDTAEYVFLGEMGLDGTVKRINGALPLAEAAAKNGIKRMIVPVENMDEASIVEGMEAIGVSSIREVIALFRDGVIPENVCRHDAAHEEKESYELDFKDVHGQHYLKRAAEIAVGGRHNILFSGPAGTGKTMIAKRMNTILPELSHRENIEISKVYSICGLLPEGKPLLSARPFRSPHHSISTAAFAGGGSNAMPGEISLASGGVLFLDELPLYSREILENLREPLEDRKITVSRFRASCTYPADFQLVAAMNNCCCGMYPSNRCSCTPGQIKAYMGRLSRPLMERIDICAEASPVKYEEFTGKISADEECSADIRERIKRVRLIQQKRFGNDFMYNSRMSVGEIEMYCVMEPEAEEFLKSAFTRKMLSGRTYHKVLKVARTIADMEESGRLSLKHISEAMQLRSLEDRLFQKLK